MASTYASSAAGSWQTERALTTKQKTPGPKAKASSGELRATATPFTPPASGSSLLSMDTHAVHVVNTNPLIPTYAQRAAAASTREGGAAAVTAKHATKGERKASAKGAPGNQSAKNTGSSFGGHLKSTDPYPDLPSKFKQKGGSQLSISGHSGSVSVPTSIAGSVSSPSTSVKSLPSTPVVPTYAQRAPSSSVLAIALPGKPKDETPLERSGNVSTPKAAKGPYPVPSTPAPTSPGSPPTTVRPSTSGSGLDATARSFSYASKLASPAPPATIPHVDDASTMERKPISTKDSKALGSKSAPASAQGVVKKVSKDKVCDPQNSSPSLIAARINRAAPIIPS